MPDEPDSDDALHQGCSDGHDRIQFNDTDRNVLEPAKQLIVFIRSGWNGYKSTQPRAPRHASVQPEGALAPAWLPRGCRVAAAWQRAAAWRIAPMPAVPPQARVAGVFLLLQILHEWETVTRLDVHSRAWSCCSDARHGNRIIGAGPFPFPSME